MFFEAPLGYLVCGFNAGVREDRGAPDRGTLSLLCWGGFPFPRTSFNFWFGGPRDLGFGELIQVTMKQTALVRATRRLLLFSQEHVCR